MAAYRRVYDSRYLQAYINLLYTIYVRACKAVNTAYHRVNSATFSRGNVITFVTGHCRNVFSGDIQTAAESLLRTVFGREF